METKERLFKYHIVIITATLAIMISYMGYSQVNPNAASSNALVMQARKVGQQIKLRWGPTSSISWERCNQVGYMLSRTTMTRNGEMTSFEERQRPLVLTTVAIRPWQTEEEWKPLMDRNDYAAVAAQALHGEQFILEASGDQDQNEVISNAQAEAQNRFSFGLFAADQSFEVAEAMGLAWIDSSAKSNENYLYKVFPAEQTDIPIDTGYTYVHGREPGLLPKVMDLEAEFSNLRVMLKWNVEIGARFYTSYEVEQSFDGQVWGNRTETPFVPVARSEDDKMAFFGDTIPFNNKPVFYRVRGKTIFGDYGPYSDVVHGSGKDVKPQFFPEIIQMIENDQGEMEIKWSFNLVEEGKIVGFKFWRSDNGNSGFIQLNEGLLPSDVRVFVDKDPLPSNYYKVTAHDPYDRVLESFPAFTQLKDETPPSPPQNVRGRITENGDLIIVWDENTEEDFMGNRVFLANRPDAEFTRVTNEPVTEGYFIYKVTLATLTEEVYVKVTALDYRQNSSLFSEIAKITRPDTIPPVAPRITGYESRDDGIEIVWENSPSRDVDRQELFRRRLGTEEWHLLKEFQYPQEAGERSFIDTDTKRKEIFEYRIVAIDDANLRSPSPAIQVQRIDDFVRDSIYNIEILVDRKQKQVIITWDYPILENLDYFQVYRSIKDNRPVTYQTISLEESVVGLRKKRNEAQYQFVDRSVRMNTEYTYQLKARFSDGAQSPISHFITISY